MARAVCSALSARSESASASAVATRSSVSPRSRKTDWAARPTISVGSGGKKSTPTASATAPPVSASRKRSGE